MKLRARYPTSETEARQSSMCNSPFSENLFQGPVDSYISTLYSKNLEANPATCERHCSFILEWRHKHGASISNRAHHADRQQKGCSLNGTARPRPATISYSYKTWLAGDPREATKGGGCHQDPGALEGSIGTKAESCSVVAMELR